MSHINTISEFLLQAGTDYRVFDMARGIKKLSTEQFLNIENALIPAPYPRQQHAWFGLIFCNKQLGSEHYIWFVKLPLDERGILISAAQNHFLQIIVDALGQQLENSPGVNGQLPENPYSFVPNQQQLADFNSISRNELKLGQSVHYPAALAYIKQPKQMDWRQVPLQGITDIGALARQKDTVNLLVDNFSMLAEDVQTSLCASLENHIIESKLSQCIHTWLMQDFKDVKRLQSGLRALSQSTARQLVRAMILKVLNSQHSERQDMFILLAARHWQQLNDEEVLILFINKLAEVDTELFINLYTDLVQLPTMRQQMLNVLRWPKKSARLTAAIGQLFSGQSQ
ncbi:MAG: hypothetical protein ACI8Z9_000661 [Paraglaciecola sp.]|jgi:hypothetical protein